jgi:hypothetical protein
MEAGGRWGGQSLAGAGGFGSSEGRERKDQVDGGDTDGVAWEAEEEWDGVGEEWEGRE